jgi:plastocyanin
MSIKQFFSMKTNLGRIILSSLLFSTIMAITSVAATQVYAQSTHSEADSTPIAAVIMMTTDNQGNPVFNPNTTTIKQGEELLVLNNLTETHTFTNGNGTGDAMDGKIFSVEIVPGSFSEYLASNISPGNYSFYSQTNPELKGELVILP